MQLATIEITKENAIKAFKEADAKGKKLLTSLLGEKNLYEKITDRVKTFEDACEAISLSAFETTSFDTPDDIAYKKLKIISKALNEGWEPDWSNSNQYKYVPYFKHKSGFGLAFNDCVIWDTGTDVGSRLCFKTEELAKYAAIQFADLYNDFLTIK